MISAADVFRVFQTHRGNAIVIATGTSGRHWRDFTTNEKRDLTMGGAMGQTTAAALGVALGLPNEQVVLFDAEGALLMNLGILATIAEQQPKNFYHFLLDNECYATTGGQPVPNAKVVAYDGLARACGYTRTYAFDNLERFSIEVEGILSGAGPVFVWLKIRAQVENLPIKERTQWRKRTAAQTVLDLRKELRIDP